MCILKGKWENSPLCDLFLCMVCFLFQTSCVLYFICRCSLLFQTEEEIFVGSPWGSNVSSPRTDMTREVCVDTMGRFCSLPVQIREGVGNQASSGILYRRREGLRWYGR